MSRLCGGQGVGVFGLGEEPVQAQRFAANITLGCEKLEIALSSRPILRTLHAGVQKRGLAWMT
jgi:hypothetical protein